MTFAENTSLSQLQCKVKQHDVDHELDRHSIFDIIYTPAEGMGMLDLQLGRENGHKWKK